LIQLTDEFFYNLAQPVWLINKQTTETKRTKDALDIEAQYKFSLKKTLDFANGHGCLLHGSNEQCLNCAVEKVNPNGFPFVLQNKTTGDFNDFWGKLQEDDHTIFLQVTAQTKAHESSHLMFEYLNSAREIERKKIAQDLHDGIAQTIYSLMLETRGLKWMPEAEKPEKLRTIDRHFADTLKEVKNLAGELRPMSLDAFGLDSALDLFISRTKEMTGFEVILKKEGTPQPLDENKRTALYRVIQEAVTNAMKYAGVNEINLTMRYQKDFLLVQLVDHGQGFEQSQADHGFGLMNMKERMLSIGGSFKLQTSPTNGTKISLTLPY
jgi:signal transduction histidine kinase